MADNGEKIQGEIEYATHIICIPFALVYSSPLQACATGKILPLNERVALSGRSAPLAFPSGNSSSDCVEMNDGTWLVTGAVQSLDEPPKQTPQELAKLLVGTPYLPAGNTYLGCDETGFIQMVADQMRGEIAVPVFHLGLIKGIQLSAKSFAYASQKHLCVVETSLKSLCEEAGENMDQLQISNATI